MGNFFECDISFRLHDVFRNRSMISAMTHMEPAHDKREEVIAVLATCNATKSPENTWREIPPTAENIVMGACNKT